MTSRSRCRKPCAWRMRDPDLVQKIVKRTSTSFYLIYHASVCEQCEQVHGKHLWNTAVKACGTTRDTLGKAWIRSVTWSTLRLVAPFPRLLYRFANERNVALGKHGLAVWSCCRVTVGGSIDPIGSLFLSIEVHETCVWDNFCIGSSCLENVCCWSGSRFGRTKCGALQRVPAMVQDKAMPKRASLLFVLGVAPNVMLKQASNWWMVHWKRRRGAETCDGKSILRVFFCGKIVECPGETAGAGRDVGFVSSVSETFWAIRALKNW